MLRRFTASLALVAFLCAATFAVADVVRISPPWAVKSDPDTFVQADEPAELLPPPIEEPYVPPVAPADEPRSCVGDATCVKPEKRKKREDRKDGDRKRDERDGEGADADAQAEQDDEQPAAQGRRRAAEVVADTLEELADLDEKALTEGALIDEPLIDQEPLTGPLCGEPEECLALFVDMLGEREGGEGDAHEPLLACEDEGDDRDEGDDGDACAALLEELFGCDSREACEELYLGALVPDDAATELDPAVEPLPH